MQLLSALVSLRNLLLDIFTDLSAAEWATGAEYGRRKKREEQEQEQKLPAWAVVQPFNRRTPMYNYNKACAAVRAVGVRTGQSRVR